MYSVNDYCITKVSLFLWKLLFGRTSQHYQLSQWVVLEYVFPFSFQHRLFKEGSCLKSEPCDCSLIAAINKLNISSFVLGVYNIQKWKKGELLGTLPSSIFPKANSHLHLNHKASVT